MPRLAEAIHVVEKGKNGANLRCKNRSRQEWETGYWVVGDATAKSLIGGMVYVHDGQNRPSHIGGKIIDIFHEAGTAKNRRVIRFRKLPSCENIIATKEGWGNERKIVWKSGSDQKIKVANDDDESAFPEGRKKYKLHRSLGRIRNSVCEVGLLTVSVQ